MYKLLTVMLSDHALSIHIKALQCSKCCNRYGTVKAKLRHERGCKGIDTRRNLIREEVLQFSEKARMCEDIDSLHRVLYRDGQKLYDLLDYTDGT